MLGTFAIVNVRTGKLWRNETYGSYNDADSRLESLDLQLGKIAPLFDVFELSPNGWEYADHYLKGITIPRIERNDFAPIVGQRGKLAIAV